MLTPSEAWNAIARSMGNFGIEDLLLAQAAGRVLRQVVRAERDLPPYDRVMMDGIAIQASDYRVFCRQGAQAAGQPPLVLKDAKACIEIATGSALPTGCDMVVPVERLVRDGDRIVVDEQALIAPGQFVHARGADCAAGAVLLEEGCVLGGPTLGVLAANGVASVRVARVPRIGIVSTGDELVDVEGPVSAFQIRESNSHALAGTLARHGWRDIVHCRIRDDLACTIADLRQVLAACDVVLLSGGVSMGPHDYVPRALAALGVERVFHKVAQRPGRPMWFGVGPASQRVFALPGNPVSALVCCVRYVVPALHLGQGASAAPQMRVVLAADIARLGELARFVPVRVRSDDGVLRAQPCSVPTSGDFTGLGQTDGFVEIPAGSGVCEAGQAMVFHAW